MKVTVFGATGQIGRLVVDDLLIGGHGVTAYVRNPGKLGHKDPRLVTISGELSDEARIQQAVRGSDAVISALGPLLRCGSKGTPVADGTKNIVAACLAICGASAISLLSTLHLSVATPAAAVFTRRSINTGSMKGLLAQIRTTA